jgi:hypothetical protein
MTDNVKLEIFLKNVKERFSAGDTHIILMKFMCRCLMLVPQFLPNVGRDTLALAKDFWLEGRGQAENLLAARIECWNYLDAKGRSVDVQDQEDAAMRALMCVLYVEPECDDFSAETVRWFASMIDLLGDYSIEMERLMEV